MSYRYLNFRVYNQDLQYLFLAHVNATMYPLKMLVHIPISHFHIISLYDIWFF